MGIQWLKQHTDRGIKLFYGKSCCLIIRRRRIDLWTYRTTGRDWKVWLRGFYFHSNVEYSFEPTEEEGDQWSIYRSRLDQFCSWSSANAMSRTKRECLHVVSSWLCVVFLLLLIRVADWQEGYDDCYGYWVNLMKCGVQYSIIRSSVEKHGAMSRHKQETATGFTGRRLNGSAGKLLQQQYGLLRTLFCSNNTRSIAIILIAWDHKSLKITDQKDIVVRVCNCDK